MGDTAVTQTTHQAADDRLAYEGGSGSPLILLHGLTGTWHIWKPLLPMLEQRHRVLALTLPGHYGGPLLGAGIEPTVQSMADGVESALQSRGITSAHFVGNSLGGWLALEMARRGRARSVVALSPAGSWNTPGEYEAIAKPFRQFYLLMPFLMIFIVLLAWLSSVRRALLRQTMEHGERIPILDFFMSLFAFMRTGILLALLQAMGREGSIAPLRAPGTPIRIVWSGSDRVIPLVPYGQSMFERVPDAEHQVMDGVGHVPMYDDPERVARSILQVTSLVDAAVS